MSASSPAHAAPVPRHPWWAVSAVGLATFSVVTIELLPVGLLTPIAERLGASTGTAGLMISLPALLAALFAPLMVIAAGGIDRRRILCALLGLLLVANLASALAPGIGWLLAARVLVGFCMGGIWAIAGGLAARLVPAHRIGRATSIIFGGVAAASVLGVPLGALIGDAVGWRSAFVAMGLFSAAVMLLHLRVVPALPVSTSMRPQQFVRQLGQRDLRRGLWLTGLLVSGHFIAFTYVRPLLTSVSGVDASWIGALVHTLRGRLKRANPGWQLPGNETGALRRPFRLPHHTLTRLSGARYSFWPSFTSNAGYQASMLRTVSARNWPGACTSVSSELRSACSRLLLRQAWAKPRKKRWSGVNPSRVWPGLPCSDSW